MRGRLTLQGLEQAVAEGVIDTVLVAQTDMQGRLMGKRFQAEFFLAGAHRETHACNYLLATDYEMETVPGFEATSWAKGYGDYVMRPDLATLRRLPWLDGTALVLCDVLDHHGHAEVPHSPRAVLRRQVRRLEAMGFRAMMASELEFFLYEQSYRDAHASGYRGLDPDRPLQRGLSHLPDHQGGGGDAGDPHRAERRRHPGRVRRRARRAPARRRSTSSTTRRSPPPTPTSSSRTRPRRSPGPRAGR